MFFQLLINLISMKTTTHIAFATLFSLLIFPVKNFAQTINLGTAANFVLFTSSGSVDNLNTSTFTGNLGTNLGSFTGFATSTVNGFMYAANAITAQASTDLIAAYNQIKAVAVTNSTHANAFGAETLFAGVYAVAGAGSVGGTLVLDAQGNVNAVFIFKIGGAFTTGASSVISLINGASACNVYWVAEGAISLAASTIMKGTMIANNAANSMGASCTLEGRMFSTTGALSTTSVTANLPVCGAVNLNWLGATSTDWNNAANWSSNSLPTSTTNITIPASTSFTPVLSSGTGVVKNITIQSGASLTLSGAKLQIAGSITNAGLFTATLGTIEMKGVDTQRIVGNTFFNNTIKNLIVSNTVVLAGAQIITGTLSFGTGSVTLLTSDSLILQSSSLGTARLADITNGGLVTGNLIKGMVSVERFIPAKRAWRLLSAPIATINAPTINVAWQEGVTTNNTISNPTPGHGTHITGGTVSNGFDQGINSNASIKIYNNASNTFVALPAAPGTNIPITNYPAYFLFVRGDRSTNLLQGASAALTATTLRMKAALFMGTVGVTVNATNFTLVGNPYPSAIDFFKLTKQNVTDMFYIWDPKLNGSNGVGGYVTLISNGVGGYSSTAAVSPIGQYIQSGEGFFVRSADSLNPGTLTFAEATKSAAGNDSVYKPMEDTIAQLRINLYGINDTGTAFLSDGILTTYNDSNSNLVDNNDAVKLYNITENMSLARAGKDLAIERRKTIVTNDTTFINLYFLKKQRYKLELSPQALDTLHLLATLKDKYTGVLNDTDLNMNAVTDIPFVVNTDPASYATDRFSIVFKQKPIVIPLKFLAVKASIFIKDIMVEWTTENELYVKNYAVEISDDGINFTNAFNVLPRAINNVPQTYNWLDKNVADGKNYYRITCFYTNGKVQYSKVVMQSINTAMTKKGIKVYGNFLTGNQFLLNLNTIEKGDYSIKIFSMEGKNLMQFSMHYLGGSVTQLFTLYNNLLPGKYILLVANKMAAYKTYLIKG